MRLKKINLLILLFSVLISSVLLFFIKANLISFPSLLRHGKESLLKPASRLTETKGLQQIKKQINTAPVLQPKKESPQSYLTSRGVIEFTNLERQKNGLEPLQHNLLLDNSAQEKAEDMFDKQYFSHDSPEGLNVNDLAENNGYEYIIIGENLALGNFLNDKELVQGWMDSPGHRENILNRRYQEIGVTVMKKNYQGKETWIAVQHFGLPLSACPQPDINLIEKIELNQTLLIQLENEIKSKNSRLEEIKISDPNQYNSQVNEYNQLIEKYNDLLAETKTLIEQYNNQAALFNQCLE